MTRTKSPMASLARALGIVGCSVFGVFYLMLAMGGASFVNECNTFFCGQLHQAVFSAMAALAVFVAAYRTLVGRSSAALIAFLGTLPILVVHTILVLTDPNEGIFFPLSSTPVPAISGLVLVHGYRQH